MSVEGLPVPRAPDKLGSAEDPREFHLQVRRSIDALAGILNSLVQAGVIVRVPGAGGAPGGGGGWTINPAVFNLTPGGMAMQVEEGAFDETLVAGRPISSNDHAQLMDLDYATANHTNFAGTQVSNTFTQPQEVVTDGSSSSPLLRLKVNNVHGVPTGDFLTVAAQRSSPSPGFVSVARLETTGNFGESVLVFANAAIVLGGTSQVSFTTPVANTVSTKFLVPLFDPGNFNQIIALGLPAGASTSARVITLFDARTAAHQPTLMVLSPDENEYFGLSWDGSNTVAQVKGSQDVGLMAGGNQQMRMTNVSGRAVALVTPVPGSVEARVGGSLFSHYATVGNGTTVETNLTTDTVAAFTLAVNGDTLVASYGGAFVSSGTATRQVRAYFGGTLFFDSGALTLSLSSAWVLEVVLVRSDTTKLRYAASLTTEGAALAAYTAVGELTGLDFTVSNVLKVTGQAAGVGAATNDITVLLAETRWFPGT